MALLALILGIITLMFAYGTNTAPEGTHNLGLLQQQMMTLHTGLALVIISAIRWDRRAVSQTPAIGETTVVDDEAAIADRDRIRKICIAMLALAGLIVLLLLFLR